MKILTVTTMMVLGFAQFSIASEAHNYVCQTADQKVVLTLDTENRPEVELEGFDSTQPSNQSNDQGNVTMSLKISGQEASGIVQVLSVVDGTKTDEFEDYGDQKCRQGVNETGIKAKVRAYIEGGLGKDVPRDLEMTCTQHIDLPQGAIECEESPTAKLNP